MICRDNARRDIHIDGHAAAFKDHGVAHPLLFNRDVHVDVHFIADGKVRRLRFLHGRNGDEIPFAHFVERCDPLLFGDFFALDIPCLCDRTVSAAARKSHDHGNAEHAACNPCKNFSHIVLLCRKK